ncbi:hypothetical protein L873DRAFT_1840312 [Choiromyces venosus 120613-1]|uniref:Uncharacterized protein n=1 Tax=Choiromyces venosus 120613-1 TaxID=1336337 RepID=A0A3N4K8R4_9PEZI|nr:hypothetical protein L873DRAFT_1840312 [Choiromyces venosus 120613-1]
MSSILEVLASLKEFSTAATLLVMLSLPSFDALREICNIPGVHLPMRLLPTEHFKTIALSIAQNQAGPEIWSDMYTLLKARTRDPGPPAVPTAASGLSGDAEFHIHEVEIFEETLGMLEDWHEKIIPVMLFRQQQEQRIKCPSRKPNRVLKLSGPTPTRSELIPLDKAILRYWTILLASVPEACTLNRSIGRYSKRQGGYALRVARYARASDPEKMRHYMRNFTNAEWAFEVFKGADKDEIRAVLEVSRLCAKTGLGHLEEIVETVEYDAPNGVKGSRVEFLVMEIANVHLKHVARSLGVKVDWRE